MVPLYEQKTVAKAEKLSQDQIDKLSEQLSPGWEVLKDQFLFKKFPFANYNMTIAFVNEVARLAHLTNHHPDMLVSYKTVDISLTTHDVSGLTTNDFILASKIDKI